MDEEKTRREIALEETLQEVTKQLSETNELVKQLKIQNEKLILRTPVAETPDDNVLFGIFDKYTQRK